MYIKSPKTTCLTVSLTSSDGLQNLASVTIMLVSFSQYYIWTRRGYLIIQALLKYCFCRVAGNSKWTKVEKKLVAKGTNRTSRFQITSKEKGTVWFDQVSLMPADTYKVYYVFVGS